MLPDAATEPSVPDATPAGTADGTTRDGTTAAPRPGRWWRRRSAVLTTLLLLAVAATAVAPWEWSFIDDGLQLTRLHANQAAHGWAGGALYSMSEALGVDRTWGLFRPSWWVYAGTFYLLPVGAAHALRLAAVLAALAGVLVPLGQRFAGTARVAVLVWAGAVLAACGQVYAGVWYPSLQELSGLGLVGLGLLARRHPAVRALCWLLAAWFKAPFAWLLLAYGLVLLRQRQTRALGAGTTVLGLGTLAAAAVMARHGAYTSRLDFGLGTAHGNALLAAGALAGPMAVLLVGILVLRPQLDVAAQPLSPVLLAGGVGYLVNLLGWHTGSYYAGPYQYLLAAGVLAGVQEVRLPSRRYAAAGLAAVVLVAGGFAASTARTGYHRLATVAGLRDCVLALPAGSTIGYNRVEAWSRLDFIARGRRPGWTSRIALIPARSTTGFVWGAPGPVRLDYAIIEPGYESVAPSLTTGPVVCRTPDATVYQVTS